MTSGASMTKQFGLLAVLLLSLCQVCWSTYCTALTEDVCNDTRDEVLPDPIWKIGTPPNETYKKCVEILTIDSVTTAEIREHYLENRTDAAISDFVRYYGRPIIYCIGLIFNVLTICVFSRNELRQVATCQFMIAIAVADILIIINGILYWIEYELLIPVMTESIIACYFAVFTVYCGPEISAINLIVMSAERLLRQIDTARHEIWFSIRRTRLYIVVIVLTMVLLNTYTFFQGIFFKECCKQYCWNIYHDSVNILRLNCTDRGEAYDFYQVYKWVSLAIYGILPWLCLPVINGWLLYEIRKERHRQNEPEHIPSIPVPGPLGETHAIDNDRDREVTTMLILVTASYLILTTGFNLIQTGIINVYTACTVEGMITWSYIHSVVILLFYLNHSSNFFLYCISVKPYRDEVKAMFAAPCEAMATFGRKIITLKASCCPRRNNGVHRTSSSETSLRLSSNQSYGSIGSANDLEEEN